MDKTGRNGLRVGDIVSGEFEERYGRLKEKHIELLKQYDFPYDICDYEKEWLAGIENLKRFRFIDSEHVVNSLLQEGKAILAEGAQGSMLDIDFGTYPFVTSSNTLCAGVCTGLGVAPSRIGNVYGIFKAYCTRVGSGPFPTELFDEDGEKMRQIGQEFGATTGRPRRCGWLDMVALKYSVMMNGVTELIMMKADVLNDFDTLKVAVAYNVNGKETSEFPYEASRKDRPSLQGVQGVELRHQQAAPLRRIPRRTEKLHRIHRTGDRRSRQDRFSRPRPRRDDRAINTTDCSIPQKTTI